MEVVRARDYDTILRATKAWNRQEVTNSQSIAQGKRESGKALLLAKHERLLKLERMKGDKDKHIRVNKFSIYILVIYIYIYIYIYIFFFFFLNGPNGLARPEPAWTMGLFGPGKTARFLFGPSFSQPNPTNFRASPL